MSAHPGDSAADRRPFPPFGPAVSRPLDVADAAPAAAAPLPPFAPFSRPEPAAEAVAPSAPVAEEEAVGVVDEYAYAPAPAVEDSGAAPADEPWAVWDAAPEQAAPPLETQPADEQPADEQPAEEPWAAWEAQPAADEAPASAASFDALDTAAPDDLPWLTVAEEEPAASAPVAAEEPASPAAGDEEMPAWMTWGGGDEGEAAAPAAEDSFGGATAPAAGEELSVGEEAWSVEFATEEAVNEGAPAAEDAVAGMEDYYAGAENAAAEEALYAPSAEAEMAPEAEPVAALPAGTADALGEVADRLERIARALRERPQEVLAGGEGADPLELLVTGFALGYAQGRRGA